jgi:RNA polymerase sigma-70 factor (ECF subfamily)
MEITINYYGQAVSVSVEVYEYLTQADHKAENLAHEQRRHWDGREFDEYIIATEGRLPYCATPEELICQRETLDEILVVLALCTDTQRERFLLYALYDFSYAEIAEMCGCSKYAVRDSIFAVRKIFQTFFGK